MSFKHIHSREAYRKLKWLDYKSRVIQVSFRKSNDQILDYDKLGARLVGGGAMLSHTYRPTDRRTRTPTNAL